MELHNKKYSTPDKDLINKKFGRWTILRKGGHSQRGRSFWFCECDCGTKRMVREDGLLNRTSKSCGCLHRDMLRNKNIKSRGESSANDIIYSYKSHAKERGLSFELTKEQAIDIMKKNCYYCGKEPNNISKSSYNAGDFIYNGIDRVDNNKGYTINNCVACCRICNGAKSKMAKFEFLEWIDKVYIYQHKGK